MSTMSGKVLKNRWKLGALVGRGACSDVYEATDIRGSRGSGGDAGEYVAKISPLPPVDALQTNAGGKRLTKKEEKAMRTNADLIHLEFILYQGYLRGHEGVAGVSRVRVRCHQSGACNLAVSRLPCEKMPPDFLQVVTLSCVVRPPSAPSESPKTSLCLSLAPTDESETERRF